MPTTIIIHTNKTRQFVGKIQLRDLTLVDADSIEWSIIGTSGTTPQWTLISGGTTVYVTYLSGTHSSEVLTAVGKYTYNNQQYTFTTTINLRGEPPEPAAPADEDPIGLDVAIGAEY